MTAPYSIGCTGIIACCITYSTRNSPQIATATIAYLRRSLIRYCAYGKMGPGPLEAYIITKSSAITQTAKMILFRVLNRTAIAQHTPLYHGCKTLVSQ